MKNKRGTHVGVVISFTIFIGFLLFLYITIKPAIEIDQGNKAFLAYLEKELIENITSELTIVSIALNEEYIPPAEKCFKTRIIRNDPGIKIIVKDEDGKILNSSILFSEDKLAIENPGGKRLLKSYYTFEEFNDYPLEDPGSCDTALERKEEYYITLIKIDNYAFEQKIIDLLSRYNTDYSGLKNDFGVPSGTEFGINLQYNNGTKIGPKYVSTSKDIYVKSVPIQFVDKDANIKFGELLVRIW